MAKKKTDKVGRTVRLQPSDELHIPGLGFDGLVGYSPIAIAKNAIGLAIAEDGICRCGVQCFR